MCAYVPSLLQPGIQAVESDTSLRFCDMMKLGVGGFDGMCNYTDAHAHVCEDSINVYVCVCM